MSSSRRTCLSSEPGSVTPTAFCVQTCEARAAREARRPVPERDGSAPTPFEISDPFGLRKAVLPVFRREPNELLVGMGTAFHLDGWGGCLTAEHVVEFVRAHLPAGGLDGTPTMLIDPSKNSHAVLLLGVGLVFGDVAVPDWAYAPVVSAQAFAQERDDPMALVRGQQTFEVAQDIAGLQVLLHRDAFHEGDRPHTLPIQVSGWTPTVGERVLALGFPQLRPSEVMEGSLLRPIIEDGLHGSYGTITGLFPQGRDRLNPTPVFEVEADWPSGMSGGPVFNNAGNVVGIVSRSLAPDGDSRGVGYATCLKWVRDLARLAPSVDIENPGYRLGYAVLDQGQQQLAGVWPNRTLALRHATQCGPGHRVLACSHRIGTDEYVCMS